MDKNLKKVLDLYKNSVTPLLQEGNAILRLRAEGLVGSQYAMNIVGTFLSAPRTTLVIASGKDEAAYLENDLANLLENHVQFFADSFKKPNKFADLNRNNMLSRTEVVSNLIAKNPQKQIIITYAQALFEKVVAPQVLEKSRIDLKKESVLDIDFLIETLVEYGFNRTDFVYEPGQFAIRGGIIDIFSFGNDKPYRLEMFDKEVENIRIFDPLTQLSVQNISKVTILPNINTQFTRYDKTSLLNILPANTLIWLQSSAQLIEQLQFSFERAVEIMDALQTATMQKVKTFKVESEDILLEKLEEEVQQFLDDRAFVLPNDVVAQIQQFDTIFVGREREFHAKIDETSDKIEFKADIQPVFNKSFDLLVKDLQDKAKKNYEIYIFTDNIRQIERFYTIFDDLKAGIRWHPIPKALHTGFIDHDKKIVFYTDHQIFNRHHNYKLKQGFTKGQAMNMRLLKDLQTGDFVTHIDHGVGRYSGLETLTINGIQQEAVRLIYKNNDILHVGINSLYKITKYTGKEGTEPKLHKLGSDTWNNLKNKTKRAIKDIAADLIRLYAKRKAAKGYAFPPDTYLQHELEASFIYEDTPDQLTATRDVKEDMERATPMDRLICGDVGFGKTEIAIRAAFKAVADGKQVAILAPTTILTLQHFNTFQERLKEFNVNIEFINRFKTAKEKAIVLEKTAAGKVEILIGTHAILSDKMKFKDLGLLIIDEEQKFGVAAKEKLRNFKVNVDTLTLTATPIPRTLKFSLMAARDYSLISTPPPNRQPIQTEIYNMGNDKKIREAIEYELYRGGQVFYVHNVVQTLPGVASKIKLLVPGASVAIAHGRMTPDELEDTLVKFANGSYDVLVSTNIVETGLDIANANTMIIDRAHMMGLSDLHQLRGRVGRSNRQAYCYLLCPNFETLDARMKNRLEVIERFSDLGSGFSIAMEDLNIRGAGNILGGEQSGFITDIGYDTYQKILNEAIEELKETDFKELFAEELSKKKTFVRDVLIEMDVEMRIPDYYVNNIAERLSLYSELDRLSTEAEIEHFEQKIEDRFGKAPWQVKELFNGIRVRRLCKELGFERLILRKGVLRCYFVTNPQSPYYDSAMFQRIMQYPIVSGDRHVQFKQINNLYTFVHNKTQTVEDVLHILEKLSVFK